MLRSSANTDPFLDPQSFAWLLDVTYTTPDTGEIEAYDIGWPAGTEQPEVGSFVIVAYDPDDPEYSVASAQALDAKPDAPPAHASPAALWTTGLGFATALAALVGTVVWARRAPRRERPVPAGWYAPGYGYPPPGYGFPPGYPPPAYPGYPAQGYPVQGYPPPGYGYPPQPYGAPPPAWPPPAPSQAPPSLPPPVVPPVGSGWDAPG